MAETKGLNVLERMVAGSLLPKQGNFATLRIVNDLIKKLSFSAEELDKFAVKAEGESVRWGVPDNDSAEAQAKAKKAIEASIKPEPIDFNNKEIEIIRKELEKLDSEGKLEQRHITLFEKFVEEKEAISK
jgi:hypothetical protein